MLSNGSKTIAVLERMLLSNDISCSWRASWAGGELPTIKRKFGAITPDDLTERQTVSFVIADTKVRERVLLEPADLDLKKTLNICRFLRMSQAQWVKAESDLNPVNVHAINKLEPSPSTSLWLILVASQWYWKTHSKTGGLLCEGQKMQQVRKRESWNIPCLNAWLNECIPNHLVTPDSFTLLRKRGWYSL